jgi:hypothetical protein
VLAKKSGQGSAAMAAVKEIGVLTGIRIERRESGSPGEFSLHMSAAGRFCCKSRFPLLIKIFLAR